jgi:3-hydroxyisobutyrate dehydrogenase
MARLGWIGLGRLGSRLAPRLIASGHVLTVYDIDPARHLSGAARVSSVAGVAAESEAVFLCVTDTAAVAAVAAALGRTDSAGKIVIDHSTTHPKHTRDIAALIKRACGMSWIDAPFSGPTGTGVAFLGGEAADVARVRPWIEAYAGTITHMGPIGAGQIAKSASQLVVATTISAWSEALAYTRAAGLDPALFLEACSGAGSDSGVRRHFGPELLAGKIEPESIRNMIKDMDIVSNVGGTAGQSMSLAAVVRSWLVKGETR